MNLYNYILELIKSNKYEDLKYSIKNYKDNDIIYNEEEFCHNLSFITNGHVIINSYTYLEKEETVNFLGVGNCFGDIISYSEYPYYIGEIISIGETSIINIEKNIFTNLLMRDKTLLEAFLMSITTKSKAFKNQAKLLAHQNSTDRIIYYITTNMNKDNKLLIPSVTKLAFILSLPRPSVSRTLSQMINDGLIKKDKNIITFLK